MASLGDKYVNVGMLLFIEGTLLNSYLHSLRIYQPNLKVVQKTQ